MTNQKEILLQEANSTCKENINMYTLLPEKLYSEGTGNCYVPEGSMATFHSQ